MVRCDNRHTYGQMIALMDVQVLDGGVFIVRLDKFCLDKFRDSGKFMLHVFSCH